jgi:hypothetical protein
MIGFRIRIIETMSTNPTTHRRYLNRRIIQHTYPLKLCHDYPIPLLPDIQHFHTGCVRDTQSIYKRPADGLGPQLRLSSVCLERPIRVLRLWNRQWRQLHHQRCDGLAKEQPNGTRVLYARLAQHAWPFWHWQPS